MEMMQQANQAESRMSVDEATLTLAASVVERARDLLADGWTQDRLYEGRSGLPERFCVHGALNLALEEVFGEGAAVARTHVDGTRTMGSVAEVEALAVAFIVEEARGQFGYEPLGLFMGAAGFNDAEGRRLDEVLSVVGQAAARLWEAALGDGSWTPGVWAQEEAVEARPTQRLHVLS